jgi:hypothetical protein
MGQPKTDETQFGMQWQKRKEKEKCGRWVRHTHTHWFHASSSVFGLR